MKIALFTCWGAGAECHMVPEGCPKEYARYENRKKFAEWIETNATGKGPYIIEEREGGAVTYEYIFASEKMLLWQLVRVALVNVDGSRPWLIHNYDGWEEIWYLDTVAADGQVLPHIVPAPVSQYRFGEAERKMEKLLSKMPDMTKTVVAGSDDSCN